MFEFLVDQISEDSQLSLNEVGTCVTLDTWETSDSTVGGKSHAPIAIINLIARAALYPSCIGSVNFI